VSTLEIIEQLAIAQRNGTADSLILKVEDFWPETYRLDVVADLVKFLNSKTEGMWLVKKANSNQGKGIKIVSDIKAYKEELLTKKDTEPEETKDSN